LPEAAAPHRQFPCPKALQPVAQQALVKPQEVVVAEEEVQLSRMVSRLLLAVMSGALQARAPAAPCLWPSVAPARPGFR